MPRPDEQARKLRWLFASLLGRYGPQRWWPARTHFEMAVGAVLTQNTSWSGASAAISALRARGLLSPERILRLPPGRLAALIRPSGTHNVKAARLKHLARFLRREAGGRMSGLRRFPPDSLREKLLGVPGIGPETADCILLYSAGVPAFIADAYARRLFSRLGGLPDSGGYELVRRSVMARLDGWPARRYNEFHALIVEHAKRHCRARPVCAGCPLLDRCETGRGGRN